MSGSFSEEELKTNDLDATVSDKRIKIPGQINGETITFVYDTGATHAVITPMAAENLGLEVTPPPSDVEATSLKTLAGITESCIFRVGHIRARGRLAVLSAVEGLEPDFDGILSWNAFADRVVTIDVSDGRFEILEKVPEEQQEWSRYPIRDDSRTLEFFVPDGSNSELCVQIDTGTSSGVRLSGSRWEQWFGGHANDPHTLEFYFIPASGLVVSPVYWSSDLALGELNVPATMVSECPPEYKQRPKIDAVLGLEALRAFEVAIDPKGGFVYLRWKDNRPPTADHNRLGAVFAPRSLDNTNLAAHVVEGGPAYRAGIRQGDLLLAVDGDDIIGTVSEVYPAGAQPKWERPAGTVHHLRLQRGEEVYQVDVTLEDILGKVPEPKGG
jgi:hypothetical protein